MPPISESGLPGYVSLTWYGLMAPSGTPKNAITRLNGEVARALGDTSVKEKLLTQGLIAAPSAPEQFGLHIKQDYEQLISVIKATGIKPN